MQELKKGIFFVFAWQGLGSQAWVNEDKNITIWDKYEVPLICYHADHPTHNLVNHSLNTKYVRHVYCVPSFSRFANQYIERDFPALYLQMPCFFLENQLKDFDGDYFVFPKNFIDPKQIISAFNKTQPALAAKFLTETAELISEETKKSFQVDHHQIIDNQIALVGADELVHCYSGPSEYNVRMQLHQYLDVFYRNSLSEFVVQELRDVPMCIYGRGWERFVQMNNTKHVFRDFGNVTADRSQFSTKFGVVDVAPVYDSLHDRTLRACSNKSSFVIGTDWHNQLLYDAEFSELFFNGKKGGLLCNAESIIHSPDLHRYRCQEFSNYYQQKYNLDNFVYRLSSVALNVNLNIGT